METSKDKLVEAIQTPIQKEWLSPKEVHQEFGFSISSLAKFRMTNKYFKYSKIGKYIKYNRKDIVLFLEAHTIETVGA